MKKNSKYFFFIIIVLNSLTNCSQEKEAVSLSSCLPCEIEASKADNNFSVEKWSAFNKGEILKINDLINIKYDLAENAYHNNYWNIKPWWINDGLDPWSEYPYWGNNYIQPNHNFKPCVDDELRWMCGYSFIVEIPDNYSKDEKYPLLIFLHGGIDSNVWSFQGRETNRNSFYKSQSDPYIFAAPIKLEIDWDAKKISDMIKNIKANINIDGERIYLTGLSMGGRGAFIVASDLPDTFAAIMPLSPHDGPYSYLPLAKKIKHIPIWMSHGKFDKVSSYIVAKQMADSLDLYGANIKFQTLQTGHWGWNEIYKDSASINWFLSWKNKK